MNIQFYYEKLQDSKEYQSFMKKNPKAFLCSGFFIIDKKAQDNRQHFDFYISGNKKIFSFELENNCKKNVLEQLGDKVPEKLEVNFDFDLNEIEKLVAGEMEKQKINNKIEKMLFSLQTIDGKNLLIGTVFLSMLGLLKVHIDIEKKKVLVCEKKSFFDMVNVKGKKK
ncbi:MAG: hypothetical protein KJ949_00950 [Nanoarchaeota archaeon]|nr:hypothetical protein [Nanoarchaeota archaeon]